MKTTPIITAKAADQDFINIKSRYADVMQGIQGQNVRVRQYQDNLKLDAQNKEILDTQKAKDSAANDIKTKELAIKQAALSL